MPEVNVTKTVRAPLDKVFSVINTEFADIYKFNPGISKSALLPESKGSEGLGAMRKCNFTDGKNWINERVIGFEHNSKIVIDIYEGTVPLKSAKVTISVSKIGDMQTKVTMKMEFTPKFGLLGALMAPMMKKQFGGAVKGLLDGLADYTETGAQIHPTLAAA